MTESLETMGGLFNNFGAGAAVAALFALAFGTFNNSLAVKLGAQRQPAKRDGVDMLNDHVVLSLQIKKVGATRVRLVGCDVALTAMGGSAEEQSQLDEQSKLASAALLEDLRISTGDGVALVPEDELEFQTHFIVPRGLAVHVKLLLHGKRVRLGAWRFANPDWSSSLVVLPKPQNE